MHMWAWSTLPCFTYISHHVPNMFSQTAEMSMWHHCHVITYVHALCLVCNAAAFYIVSPTTIGLCMSAAVLALDGELTMYCMFACRPTAEASQNCSVASSSSAPAAVPSQTYFVYCITCTVNSRRYIGSTTNMRRRFREHARTPPSRMKHDADLYKPFHANFLMTELAHTDSKHKVNRLEYHYIKHHVTQGSQGYNIAKQDPTHSKQFWYLHRRGLM